jgi:hypothetical protein
MALQAKAEPGSSLYKAQTRRTVAAAEREELLVRRQKGELVERRAAEREWFKLSRQVRDRLENIAPRIAGLVAVEKNQEKCFAIIQTEIAQALEGLAS